MLYNQICTLKGWRQVKSACAIMGLLMFAAPAPAAASTRTAGKPKTYGLASPDGKIAMTVKAGETICYSVSMDSKEILKDDQIAMNIETADGKSVVWGEGDKVLKSSSRSSDQTSSAAIYRKASVRDNFNELTLSFKDFDLIFRAETGRPTYLTPTRATTPMSSSSPAPSRISPTTSAFPAGRRAAWPSFRSPSTGLTG